MKIVIDIPDEAYEMLKNKAELDNIAESIIANGKPYEDRPQGEWLMENKLYGGYGDSVLVNTCSICKTSFIYRGKTQNFCSNCGADMRGGDRE